jgi:hypothetical protein
MTIKQPRVAISLPYETKIIYQETAKLMHVPMSKLITNLLVESQSSIEALQKPLKMASKSRVESLGDMVSILENVQEEAKKQQIDIEEQISRDKK